MECKGAHDVSYFLTLTDLIDTLWNVKDTTSAEMRSSYSRFNRYIVECKGAWLSTSPRRSSDLIDTLWNVKSRLPNMAL